MSRPDPATLTSLDELRAGIDAIDTELLTLFAERQAHVDSVAGIKAKTGLSAAAPTRYAAVIDRVRDRAADAGFDPDIAEGMWRVMIDGFIAQEQQVLGTEGEDA
ncbi:chorismate mutase [Pseudooceanicola sp.]|uniref:chorismate mutase n=1 Tax=Pseudooceanicola sp. TaxID=1914328 RepID=UPI0035C6CF4A